MKADELPDEMTLDEYLDWYAAHGQQTAVRVGRSSGKKKDSTDWGQVLIDKVVAIGLPMPTREYQFHADRRWKLDLAWRDRLVACEIEGGIWMQTKTGRGKGHAHPKRFLQDVEKYNELALYGWTLIRVTPEMIEDGRALDWLDRALL